MRKPIAISKETKILLALVGVGLGATACGSGASAKSTEPPHGVNTVLAAYHRTVAEKSADFTLTESITTSSGTVSLRGSGSANLGGKIAEMTMSIPGINGSIAMRLIEPEIYVELPAGDRTQVPGDKPWISIDLDTVTKTQLGASLSQLQSSSQSPMQALAFLEATSTSGVKALGSATIDGVSTTKYEGTVDLNKVPANSSSVGRTAIKKIESELGTSAMPIDAWIDADNRVRQMSFVIKSGSGATGALAGTSVSVTTGFSNFGTPLSVTAPPASDTYNATGQLTSGGSGS